MIVEIHVAANGVLQAVVAVESLPVIEVGLHRLVPGFHVRVVGHATRSIGRLHEAGTLQLMLNELA